MTVGGETALEEGEAFHQMLSIENPPPDPPCPCQVPLLNNPSFDERASTSHTLAFSEVDLQSKNPPPPNFSIR